MALDSTYHTNYHATCRGFLPATPPLGWNAGALVARLRAAWTQARINRLERRFETGRMSEGAFEARQDALWRRLRALRAQMGGQMGGHMRHQVPQKV